MAIFFSIVIPSYNRADHIAGAIQSFLNQDYRNFELIVVDDGSKDNTEEVVASFNDKRIQYHYKKNEERGVARNFGAGLSKGDYVTFFDSDDIVYPWYLSHAAEDLGKLNNPECYAQSFEFRTEIPATFSRQELPDESVKSINESLVHSNFLACNGVFVRRDVFKNFKFSFDRELSGSEDWVLWLQLAANFKFPYSPVVCSCLVVHPERGEANIVSSKLIPRLNLLLSTLKNDQQILKFSPGTYKKLLSSGYLFAAVKLADFNSYKGRSIKYLWMSFLKSPGVILKRNFYIANQKIAFRWTQGS